MSQTKDFLDIQGLVQKHPDLDHERIQDWVVVSVTKFSPLEVDHA